MELYSFTEQNPRNKNETLGSSASFDVTWKKKSSSNLGTVSNAFSYTEEIQTDCKYLSIFLNRGHWLCKLDRDRFFDPG